MNMFSLLLNTAEKYPDNIFLVRENINYAKFIELIKMRANTLIQEGVKANDVVGLLSHNIPQFPITMFAVWYLGAQALMLDTNLTSFEYDNMTALTDCKIVIAEKAFFYKTDKFKFFDIETKDIKINSKIEPANVNGSDIAILSFTSGSTGSPKIVPLSHFNLTQCANSLEDMKNWIKTGDILYGFLPIYHVFGFAVEILATIHFGAGVLLQSSINPKEILADFKKYRPHMIPAVPRIWEVFRNKIIMGIKEKKKWWLVRIILKYGNFLKKIGLGFLFGKVQKQILDVFGGRVRLLVAGGAATKPEVENFYQRLGLTFIQGYGLTETVGPICISRPIKKRFPYSIGGPIKNNEVQIRDKNLDGIGTLWLRGYQVFSGYLNNKSANKEVFDEDVFFNTGDLVTMDKNGELHFAGRSKQVIVLDSGKNVYPEELECLFMEIKGVKNVAVFEHKIKNKTVAYAVFSTEDDMTIEKLSLSVAHANKKLAGYKWVSHFAMTTDDFPITSTQKVKHHKVRQNLIDGEYPIRRD